MSYPENDLKPGLISILMPVHNAGPFLRECLDSILQQTIPEWELIVVNDHSTDDSQEILCRYAQADPRIRVFQNSTKGIIPALRLAIEKAGGSLVTRMDADDMMVPEKLADLRGRLVLAGEGHVAIGLVEYISEGDLGDGFARYQDWLNKLTLSGDNYRDLYRECVIPSPCWMVFRSDLDRAGGFSPDRYPEDYDLCFRFYEAGLKCLPSGRVLHKWRDHPGRASRNDPNYADHTFIDLKVFWFLRLHHSGKSPIIVWGAGRKGKRIAKQLIRQGVEFQWVTNNRKKIGKRIYGMELLSDPLQNANRKARMIIAVASPEDQEEITSYLNGEALHPMQDYFYFC